jgi:hypothetical protein
VSTSSSGWWDDSDSDKLDRANRSLRRQAKAEQRSNLATGLEHHGTFAANPLTDEQLKRRKAADDYFRTGRIDPCLTKGDE